MRFPTFVSAALGIMVRARRDLPAATVRVPPPTIGEADPPRNGQVPSRLRNPAEHIFPATLEPVGVLSPAQALSSERTGQ